jgi:hypothetical protein
MVNLFNLPPIILAPTSLPELVVILVSIFVAYN